MSQNLPEIPLPKAWPNHVRSAVAHVIALGRAAIVAARGKAANSRIATARWRAKLDSARAEISMLQEELRIKDARMARLNPRKRPHYRASERMAIIELRAARGWSQAEASRVFLVEPGTIRSWWKRIDEEGDSPLVMTPVPVNKFPDFVRYIVCRLRVLHPTFGKKRIAQVLARAGLHIGVTTVKRMLEQGRPEPHPDGKERDGSVTAETAVDETAAADAVPGQGVSGESAGSEVADSEATAGETPKRPTKPVKSSYPDHVWQVDLTLVPTAAGYWVPWFPLTVAQQWPFCWWVASVVDHFSRRVIGFTVLATQPSSVEVRTFLGRAIAKCGKSPRYLISDLGSQFDCDDYRSWCYRKGVMCRYSSAGSRGATAVVERYFRSLKDEMLRRGIVSLRREELWGELSSYVYWFNEHRPHQGIGGRTPNEVYREVKPANEKARIEPRPRWPRGSPCALPTAAQRGKSGRVVHLAVRYHDGDKRLPIVELRRAA